MIECNKIPTADILDYEKLLPFLYYFTDRHQNQWKHLDFISLTSEMHIWKIQDGGRCHLEFRKTVVICFLFDQSTPNLVAILLLDLEHVDDVEKVKYPQFKVTVAAIFNLE